MSDPDGDTYGMVGDDDDARNEQCIDCECCNREQCDRGYCGGRCPCSLDSP